LFCLGVFLSFGAHWILVQHGNGVIEQIGVSIAGLAITTAVAWLLDRAQRVPNLLAEMIAHHACVGPLLELGRAEEARPHIERARAIVRELEAWRFEPENLAFLAEKRPCSSRGSEPKCSFFERVESELPRSN
jgi:hypothetical protein